ncbi:hypothetical protein DFQ03_2857 [Maribacter caenipelagi]|uniref:Uncharacterized protein n=1 Tax=Maribacter caenipelagi TaxID=1447781 RepID=A0A4R7D1X8_9FLAO|nr:hypothetical protein [Maribacter caenipelagi]TDS13564.1 hypothetical protein DFQ03_2857 [Maribacter caenipelagi]
MIKRILNYLGWYIVAILLGFLHMRIVLGPSPKSDNNGIQFLNGIHDFVLLYVGTIIGSIIAVIFILFDVFYFNKKIQNNNKATIFRFIIITIITIIVGSTHYFLEKIANVV